MKRLSETEFGFHILETLERKGEKQELGIF